MHEKTLLYGALGFTALGAIFGVYRSKTRDPLEIAPVALVDAHSKVTAAEVPIRLTASDGTGLKLVALRTSTALEDPLALTEMHLEFENPEDRILEGTFRITLPQGASLSRFAMKINDTWQEGEVVEKQAARRAYEDSLHRKQDPALLEQGAGNEFSARVFPIPARAKKEIIVTYAERLEGGSPYVLPLRGLPELGVLDVDVHAAGRGSDTTFGLHRQRFTPASDFVVDGKRIPRSAGLRSGELVLARVVPFTSSRPDPIDSAIVLVDTSASRGLGLTEQAQLVKALLAKMPPNAPVSVACFDQEVASIYEGSASGFGEKEAHAIIARGALGASDFEQALAWVADRAKIVKASRLVLVSDGVATAGETSAQKLHARVEALRATGIARMDAIALGGIRDDDFLRTVVRGVLDKDGVVLDAKLGADALVHRLGEGTSSGLPVKVQGASWSWPEKLDGLQAGDEVLVYAEVDATSPVEIAIGSQTFTPDLRTAARPLVERAWAQAKIQSLVESPKENAAATKREIVALSTKHRVLSPETALLVLESDADYTRFRIDRNAKLDILAVRDGRVALTSSSRLAHDEIAAMLNAGNKESPARARGDEGSTGHGATATPEDPLSARGNMWGSEVGDAFGAGGLGLSGVGEGGGGRGEGIGLGTAFGDLGATGTGQGFGNGHGRLGGAHAEAAPRITEGPITVAPTSSSTTIAQLVRASNEIVRPTTLDAVSGIAPEEAQRVIRGAVPRIRACYSEAVTRDTPFRGRLVAHVVIDPRGAVKSVDIPESPGNGQFNGCVADTIKWLTFTAPVSAGAELTQAFDLVDQGGAVDDAAKPHVFPYEGRFKTVMTSLKRGDKDRALAEATRWHTEQPGDILSLVALGEVFEARGEPRAAARAYGSILELFSFRADSRRFAGERLEHLADPISLRLAADTYAKAVEQRPDHPASHRLYAFALLKSGQHEKAFEAMKKGASRTYPWGRFAGVGQVLKEDLGLIAAVWTKAEPSRTAEIQTKLRDAGGYRENGPSLRFVLNWETDANDVDFHIRDGKGGHAYYGRPALPSGGKLYADVTTGYGPECFAIRLPADQRAYPYELQAHYYSRGPMGYGMGKLQVLDHDGKGNLSFEERPFVVMVDRAFVDMGKVEKTSGELARLK